MLVWLILYLTKTTRWWPQKWIWSSVYAPQSELNGTRHPKESILILKWMELMQIHKRNKTYTYISGSTAPCCKELFASVTRFASPDALHGKFSGSFHSGPDYKLGTWLPDVVCCSFFVQPLPHDWPTNVCAFLCTTYCGICKCSSGHFIVRIVLMLWGLHNVGPQPSASETRLRKSSLIIMNPFRTYMNAFIVLIV